tara:strand:+ start:177 stop:1448 length:1272 start_codon:yes stop_codon:yes gene_type:complete
MPNNILIIVFCLFISACSLDVVNNKIKKNLNKNTLEQKSEKNVTTDSITNELEKATVKPIQKINPIINVVLPSTKKYKYISDSFINSLEMAVFDLQNETLRFEIDRYDNETELEKIFSQKSQPGKIFIGPLISKDVKKIQKYCDNNILIFSFASDRSLANDCIYLFNFFIEDDLKAIFSFFDEKNKVALLYPNNEYGNYVNSVIEIFAKDSLATLIYRVTYEEDLSDIREVIKQLGKYDFRKEELKKQIEILEKRNDEISLLSLNKLKKFETIGELDFTHLIISDGNIRILELVPLLPFYDIDPNRIKFVGTGLWDEKSFFDEPSLQGVIFPGTEFVNRSNFVANYLALYNLPPPRTATMIYDISSLISYLINNFEYISEISTFLNNDNNFMGLDGKFSIKDNIVKRDLSILTINDGEANLVN